MKGKIILAVLVAVMVVGVISMIALAGTDNKGNGLPKGKSYNFNVIGVPKEKNWDDESGGEGKRIFILRTGTTWFYVQGGDTFDIVDHDGTDGKVGSGGTPTANPDDVETGITNAGIILPYDTGTDTWNCRVFVRLLGPVDSSFRWTSYYFDDTNSEWALISQFTLDRSTKFSERTEQILEDGYQDILWQWDQKNDFRICQFRIFVED
jgi:hypothetical protein